MQRTHHLNIPYYVREQFKKEYQGSIERLESNIEEEYIVVMKQNCFRERSYREYNHHRLSIQVFNFKKRFAICVLFRFSGDLMIARARNFGGETQLEHAKSLKVPSCDSLIRLGLTKFTMT